MNTAAEVKLQVWLPQTCFNIVARANEHGGYLGCISSSRVLQYANLSVSREPKMATVRELITILRS